MAIQVYRTACNGTSRLSKTAFLAMLPTETSVRTFFDGIDPQTWEIYSFNPQTREACIVIHASSGNRMLSIKIPAVMQLPES